MKKFYNSTGVLTWKGKRFIISLLDKNVTFFPLFSVSPGSGLTEGSRNRRQGEEEGKTLENQQGDTGKVFQNFG